MLKHHLRYYATQFDTAELNGVFYRTPSLETVRNWRENSPDDFIFAWKASRFISHWKRLSENSRNSLDLINERLRILGPKAGPVLFQLPARFERNEERLRTFLPMLSKRWRYAFEFRHHSWYCDDVFCLLEKKQHLAVLIGSSRCASTLGDDCAPCLCPRPRTRRPLQRTLFKFGIVRLGGAYQEMAASKARCFRLF
jgi:uncharacterized protein YecE (DUF72 family)